jgi:hypothetical protein
MDANFLLSFSKWEPFIDDWPETLARSIAFV